MLTAERRWPESLGPTAWGNRGDRCLVKNLSGEARGPCPSCGAIADHIWFAHLWSDVSDEALERAVPHIMEGRQGALCVSRCMSQTCRALALWLRGLDPQSGAMNVELVYPQVGVRKAPAEGLNEEEVKLYDEAAAVAPVSRRAACALLRVLLEAFLKRHLTKAGQSSDKKPLVELIELAVQHLDLSQTLKKGLTAIRKRGNTAVHDPYGLTDDARAEDLPWLFQAVDDLVDDLHVKPKKWAGISNS